MNKNEDLMIKIQKELDDIGEALKDRNITDKEILDAYKKIREVLI